MKEPDTVTLIKDKLTVEVICFIINLENFWQFFIGGKRTQKEIIFFLVMGKGGAELDHDIYLQPKYEDFL